MNDFLVKAFQKTVWGKNGEQITEYNIKAENDIHAIKLAKEKTKDDKLLVNFYICSLVTKD